MRYILYIVVLMTSLVEYAVAQSTYILGRAPQRSPMVTSKAWTPFVEYLSKQTGYNIKLKVYASRDSFEEDIKKGSVDLYFGNPGYGVVGHVKHGYIPLVRSDRKLLEGIIVTRKDSNIKTIEQLNGKIIAFPSKSSFAASLYIRSHLDTEYSLNYKKVYAGSHDNAYRAVLVGKAVASGGVIRTLEQEKPKLRQQLEIIYTTPGVKSHPLMVHPNVALKVHLAIQKSILALAKDDEGKKLLKSVKLQKPVVANYTKDYKPVESLSRIMYSYMLE